MTKLEFPEELLQATLQEILDGYNLLGYDNGDGELSCSTVCLDKDGKLSAKPLTFSQISTVSHIPNILAFGNNGKALLLSDQDLSNQRNVYHNFKRCPAGRRAEEKYFRPDGKQDGYTYGQLMGHSFACAIRRLFDCNSCLDREKPTIILVGRPASRGWEDQEDVYAQLLQRYLTDYMPEAAAITVQCLSESCAAMAGELTLEQSQWLNQVIQILDLGSSTFDSKTVTPNGLPADGEQSFQFGGNQLDQAITKFADACYCAEYPAADGYVLPQDPGRVASLRFKKEQLYGDNGENLKQIGEYTAYNYVYPVCRTDGNGQTAVVRRPSGVPQQCPFPLTKGTITTVLYNKQRDLQDLKCTTQQLADPFFTTDSHDSWREACRYVLTQFYELAKPLYPEGSNAPGRLILTGGVSNMPEVQEIAREVFHVDEGNCTFTVSEHPSLTVSNGLALILGNEIQKKRLLREVERELPNRMPNADSLREEMAEAACKSDLDYYEEVIQGWADATGDNLTLGACIQKIQDPNNGIFDQYNCFLESACQSWYQKQNIDQAVHKLLQEKYAQMFPQLLTFVWQPQMPTGDGQVRVLNNPFPIAHPWVYFSDANCPANPYNLNNQFTREQRQEILQVYRSHRADLADGGTHSLKGRSVNVPGIREIYRKQFTTEGDAEPCLAKLLAQMVPALEDFVERVTYYLTMSTTAP